MKEITEYIIEKFKIGQDTRLKQLKPKNKYELNKLLEDELKEDPKNLILTNIDISDVDNLSWLFNSNKFKKVEKIDISNWDFSKVKDMHDMFKGCENLKEVKFGKSEIDLKVCTNLSGMFSRCKSLEEIDLSMFNTHYVTNISSLFSECENLKKVDISMWDIKDIQMMNYTFKGCKNLKLSGFGTLNSWNIDKDIVKCENMFKDCDESIIPDWYKK